MPYFLAARRRFRRAFTLVQLVLCLTVFMGLLAVTIDGGLLLAERRHAQAVADAAALSAAADLYANWRTNLGSDSGGTAAASAKTTAANNGYTSTNSTVTPHIPPTTGDHVGVAGYAEVVVTYNQSRFFSSIWGSGTTPVSARAVARGLLAGGTPTNSSLGFLVTDPGTNGASSVYENGKTGINVANGSFAENSANSPFDSKGNNAEVTANSFVFGAANSQSLGSPPNFNGPTPTYNTVTADPFSSLAAPSSSGLPSQTYSGGTTMNPGVYTGVINIGGNSTVTMSPGIYYLQPDANGNAGITMSGTASLDGTSGVLIYVAPPTTPGTGTMTLSNGGVNSIALNPISTGTYEGVSIYVDRAWGNGNTNGNSNVTLELGGTPTSSVYGTIYAPTANFILHGTPNANTGSQVIVYTVTAKGSSAAGVGTGPRAGQATEFQLVE
jgi:Flp pilus assembly protein TadG